MTYSLLGFAALLLEATGHVEELNHSALEHGAKMLEDEAKSLFGTSALVPNAPATVAIKGFDAPGFETGETQESITHNSDAHEAYVGSNDIKMVWLEHGTSKTGGAWGGPNPPRPILGIAATRGAEAVVAEIGREIMTKILG